MARATKVEVDIRTDIPESIHNFIIENEEAVAGLIANRAKATTAFKDKTGRLRKSIKAQKSRHEGWIVKATAPHAHLVELGTSNMAAKPFLRPALEAVINEARRLFEAK